MKSRIPATILAVLLMLAAVVIFFWQYITLWIFPRTEYVQPTQAPTQAATATPAPTTAPPSDATATAEPSPTPSPAPTMDPKWSELFETNGDLVGWVNVPGTNIDYPVVKSTEEENALVEDGFYYLHYNFDKKEDLMGAIFMYPACDVLENDRNIVIFGHNMGNGTMFGTLKRYNLLYNDDALSFYKKNPVIEFNSIYEDASYKIIGALLIDEKDENGYFNFVYNNFASDDVFSAYVETLLKYSMLDTAVDVQADDKLLMLASCTPDWMLDDGKFVVICRKVRPGEALDVDTDAASFNVDAIMPTKLQSKWAKLMQ